MPHGLHATMASKQEWERPTQLVAAALHPQIVLKKTAPQQLQTLMETAMV